MSPTPFHVLVTRPSPQGEELCTYLRTQGFDPIFFPAMEIQPLANLDALKVQITQLDQYDYAIFVSRSAVRTSAELIHEQWGSLPDKLKIGAIGEGSAQALERAGVPVNLVPVSEWNSEGFLSLPELQELSHKKIAIFCGEGGRDYLEANLKARGAEVTRFISYQRVLPGIDAKPYLKLLNQNKIAALVCTSGEGVINMKALFGPEGFKRLQTLPLVLISERIMIMASAMGFQSCVRAKDASHASVLAALQTLRKTTMSQVPSEAKVSLQPVARPRQSTTYRMVLLGLLFILAGVSGLAFLRVYMLSDQVSMSLTQLTQQVQADRQKVADLESALAAQKPAPAAPSIQNQGPVANARYLVNLANDQLLLTQNVPQAIIWLTRAQNELNTVSTAEVEPLKKAVSQDLSALKALTWTDPSDLYTKVTDIQKQVSTLPLLIIPAAAERLEGGADTSESTGWRKSLKQSWQVIRSMVVVYRLPTKDTPPFITPAQRPYLYQNLHATLGASAWAVLNHDQDVYQKSLAQAQDWLSKYFLANAATQKVLADLQSLQAQSVQVKDISALKAVAAFDAYTQPTETAPTNPSTPG